MKKYQIIGFILWTLGNILLFLRMWDYILIAPVLAVQDAIWICCNVLFSIDISSRGLFIASNTTIVITGLLDILYFLYYRNPIGVITLIAVFAVIFKNFVFGRKRKKLFRDENTDHTPADCNAVIIDFHIIHFRHRKAKRILERSCNLLESC